MGSRTFCTPQGGPGHHPEKSEWCQVGWSLVDLGVLVDHVDLGVCIPEVLRHGGEGGTQSGGPAGLWGGKLYVRTGLVSELSDVNWFSSLVIRSLDRLSLDFFSLLFLRTVLPSLVLFSPQRS